VEVPPLPLVPPPLEPKPPPPALDAPEAVALLLAPRLAALEAQEPPPKIMPRVIDAWASGPPPVTGS
jgi:hypothetical protein